MSSICRIRLCRIPMTSTRSWALICRYHEQLAGTTGCHAFLDINTATHAADRLWLEDSLVDYYCGSRFYVPPSCGDVC